MTLFVMYVYFLVYYIYIVPAHYEAETVFDIIHELL